MYENHRCIFTLLSDISLMCSYYPRVRWRFISSMITKKNFLKTGIYGLQMPLLHILFRNKNAYFHENLWNVMILEVWEWKWSSIFLLTVNLLLPFETVIGLNKTCKCPRSCAVQQWHGSRVIKLIVILCPACWRMAAHYLYVQQLIENLLSNQ